MVLTSHENLHNTESRPGFWLEEFAAPYYGINEAGAEIRLASPFGRQPPIESKSGDADSQTDASKRTPLPKPHLAHSSASAGSRRSTRHDSPDLIF